MLNDEHLEDVLYDLQSWLYWKDQNPDSNAWKVSYLLELPQSYVDKVKNFISKYSLEELKEFSIDDFITEATGESPKTISDYISKLIKIRSRRTEMEKDFKPIESLN